MKTKVLLFIFTLIFASCNKEEEKINIEDVQIAQTAWRGTYDFPFGVDDTPITKGKIQISFASENTGYCSMEYFGENNKQHFDYYRNKNQINFSGIQCYLSGPWLMTPTGKNSIRLTRYKSYEKADILELERVDNQ